MTDAGIHSSYFVAGALTLLAPCLQGQYDPGIMDLAGIIPVRTSDRYSDPDRKTFPIELDLFQPIPMEGTQLRPFDGADHSTLLMDAPDTEALWALEQQTVRFAPWSVEIDPVHDLWLEGLAARMERSQELKLRIEAHTDNVGAPAVNMELSSNRAQAVKDRLIELGVSEERITCVGYGDRFPISSNADRSGRSLNRRVEFRFLGLASH